MHRFSVQPHFGYAPKATITIYRMVEGILATSSFTVELYDDFKNFIEVDVSRDVAKPGDIVDIKVKSSKNAYIGLLGIDQSALILRGDNDLTRENIWSEVEETDFSVHMVFNIEITSFHACHIQLNLFLFTESRADILFKS